MAETIDLPRLPEVWRSPPRGRVLVFAPHPDDETLGAGGTLRLHADQGDAVRIVVLTAGLAGDPDSRYSREELLSLREREAREAAAILGAESVELWRLPDGCQISTEDLRVLIPRIRETIAAFDPSTVYCPWEGESHVDHFSTFLLVRGAVAETRAGITLYGYEVWNPSIPDVVVDVTRAYEAKTRALARHESQIGYTDLARAISGLNAHRALFLPKGSLYGEALVRLRA